MSDRPVETEYSALQALLQIRTNSSGDLASAGQAGENPSANNEVLVPPATANVSPAVSISLNSNDDIVNLMRISANPTAFLQQAQLTYPPAQLAAIRAAAASLQNPTGGGRFLQAMHNPAFQGNALHSPFQAATALAAATVATAPRSPAIDMPQSPALSPLRPAPQILPRSGTISPTVQGLAKAEEEADAAEKKIRKDEVEAALRSKPQRGRKRENLNAEERLELTRTRNREHAKSTRIRKKARYQELLDTEQRYLELKNSAELEAKRRETILGFLEARASMLSNTIKGTMESKQPGALNASQGDRTGNENRSISFDQAERLHGKSEAEGESTKKTCLKEADSVGHVTGCMTDENSFVFETSMGDVQNKDASTMSRFDENVSRRLQQMLGADAASCHIEYHVIGSSGGIAINKDGSAFARVNLTAANDVANDGDAAAPGSARDDTKVLISSLVSLDFVNGSHLIKYVAWCVLTDATGMSGSDSANGSKSDSTAKESLESQTVYPSVVSFDEAQKEKAKDRLHDATMGRQESTADHMMEDPGMSI